MRNYITVIPHHHSTKQGRGLLFLLAGQDLLQTGEAGQTVLGGAGVLTLDQGQSVVDEALVDAVASLVDPLQGHLLLTSERLNSLVLHS